MQTYLLLARWTFTGNDKLKDSPARLDAARQGLASKGINVISFYLTLGAQDMAIIAEAPDDSTMAAAVLSVLSTGTVTINTSLAFREDEYRKLFASLP